MKKLLVIIPLLILAGCATNSIDAVNKACAEGNIDKFRERKDGDELMFSCFKLDNGDEVAVGLDSEMVNVIL